MAPPWVQLLELIANGEAVDAKTPNRPIQQLAQRTEYLKALVDTVTSASGTFDLNAAFSTDVQEGFPVYWNHETQRYEPAQALLDSNNSGLYSNIADSAYAVGVCASKESSTRGTVVFSGKVEDVDFSNAIDGDIVPGPYYLSSVQAGGLVKQKPPVGINILFMADTNGTAFIMPTPRELLENHIHYGVEFENGNTVGDPGWTATFDTALAPAGAAYRYTHEDDEKVNSLFPFYPAETVYFDIDGIGANDKVIFDNNGIWWIDADNDPDKYETMTVYWTRMTVKSDQTMVTSLQPQAEDSLIQFVDCFGNEATAGDLYAILNLVLNESAADEPGYLVFKSLTEGSQLKKGPVVESVVSGSPELAVTLSEDEGVLNEDGSRSGKLVVSYLDPQGSTLEGEPVTTSLDNAVQEDWDGLIPYVGLPTSIESAINYQFNIPTSGLSGTYDLQFKAVILGTVGGVLPSLTCDYKIVDQANGSTLQNVDDNATVTDVDLDVGVSAVSAGQYIEGSLSTTITVAPGQQVHVAIKRNDSSYGGTVGVLKAYYTMISA